MLINASHVKGLSIRATDGDIGLADELYFDDETWTVRYVTVETGGWLGGRPVLISPFSIVRVDWQAEILEVSLTKAQVEGSPDINTHQPVSRQHETEYLGYYGYPNYWGGRYPWGPSYYPMGLILPAVQTEEAKADRIRRESADSHLRSIQGVSRYEIHATDGDIGHAKGFILDDETWAIRYMEVATRNWWPGKKVLISPAWIEKVSWNSSEVFVAVSREAIQSAPEYVDPTPIDRKYEDQLYRHYGTPPYWLNQEPKPALSLSAV